MMMGGFVRLVESLGSMLAGSHDFPMELSIMDVIMEKSLPFLNELFYLSPVYF